MNIKLNRFFLESIFDMTDFNNDQLAEISIGLDNRVDVSIYANPAISAEEMKNIRYSKQTIKLNIHKKEN